MYVEAIFSIVVIVAVVLTIIEIIGDIKGE